MQRPWGKNSEAELEQGGKGHVLGISLSSLQKTVPPGPPAVTHHHVQCGASEPTFLGQRGRGLTGGDSR